MDHNLSPEEALKILEKMSIEEIKEAIVQTVRRQGRAEADLKYYKESYGDVIKEEKEARRALMARLEVMMEADRVRAARDHWLNHDELGKQIETRRAAAKEAATANAGTGEGPKKDRGFLKAVKNEDETTPVAGENEDAST